MPNRLYYIRRDELKKTLVDIHCETKFAVSYLADIERSKVLPQLDEVDTLAPSYGITGAELAEITGRARQTIAFVASNGAQKYIICTECHITEPDGSYEWQELIRIKWENDKRLSRVCQKCGKDIGEALED